MKPKIFIQRAGGHYEGWMDTESGRARYSWSTVARLRRWLRLYKADPVILDFNSLSQLESMFEA